MDTIRAGGVEFPLIKRMSAIVEAEDIKRKDKVEDDNYNKQALIFLWCMIDKRNRPESWQALADLMTLEEFQQALKQLPTANTEKKQQDG